MRIVLFQPDIPQNLGGAVRLCACLGAELEVVEPCGFPLSDRALRRAALDYGDPAAVRRHASFARFLDDHRIRGGRLLLLTTRAEASYLTTAYQEEDALLFGRESAGAPPEAHEAADGRLRIPMTRGRSLNLVTAVAIVLGEARRQLGPSA